MSLAHLRTSSDYSSPVGAESETVAATRSLDTKTVVLPPRLAYTIEETAHVLGGVCQKTVRRLIARKLLRPSRGLRCPLIPIWEIVRYLVATSGHSAKEQERLIQLFYESFLIVHGKPPRRDFEIQR